MRGGQHCQRVTILVPSQTINARSHIAWELEHRLALPVHDPDDLVVAANCDQIAIPGPRSLGRPVAKLIRRVLEDLFDVAI